MISFAHVHAFHYFHLLQERQDVEIVGIADDNRERVEHLLKDARIPYYADYRDLLKGEAEAVIICSENTHHAELTIAAAFAGKHVMCEKPLGTSREEMQRMINACRGQGVQLMTAFPNRYLLGVQKAKQEIDAGTIGEVIAIKGTNKGEMPGGWFIDHKLSGGGALLDHSVHVMDIMNWILGSRVVEVYAEMDTLFHDIDIDDTGMLHAKFANGVIAVLDTSWSRTRSFPFKRDITLEIIGTKGSVRIDASKQINELYSDASGSVQWSQWGDDKDELLIDDFVSAIRNGTPVPITGEDGLHAAVVSFAAYESVKRNKPVLL